MEFGDHLIKFRYVWKKVVGASETYLKVELVEHFSYAQWQHLPCMLRN